MSHVYHTVGLGIPVFSYRELCEDPRSSIYQNQKHLNVVYDLFMRVCFCASTICADSNEKGLSRPARVG